MHIYKVFYQTKKVFFFYFIYLNSFLYLVVGCSIEELNAFYELYNSLDEKQKKINYLSFHILFQQKIQSSLSYDEASLKVHNKETYIFFFKRIVDQQDLKFQSLKKLIVPNPQTDKQQQNYHSSFIFLKKMKFIFDDEMYQEIAENFIDNEPFSNQKSAGKVFTEYSNHNEMFIAAGDSTKKHENCFNDCWNKLINGKFNETFEDCQSELNKIITNGIEREWLDYIFLSFLADKFLTLPEILEVKSSVLTLIIKFCNKLKVPTDYIPIKNDSSNSNENMGGNESNKLINDGELEKIKILKYIVDILLIDLFVWNLVDSKDKIRKMLSTENREILTTCYLDIRMITWNIKFSLKILVSILNYQIAIVNSNLIPFFVDIKSFIKAKHMIAISSLYNFDKTLYNFLLKYDVYMRNSDYKFDYFYRIAKPGESQWDICSHFFITAIVVNIMNSTLPENFRSSCFEFSQKWINFFLYIVQLEQKLKIKNLNLNFIQVFEEVTNQHIEKISQFYNTKEINLNEKIDTKFVVSSFLNTMALYIEMRNIIKFNINSNPRLLGLLKDNARELSQKNQHHLKIINEYGPFYAFYTHKKHLQTIHQKKYPSVMWNLLFSETYDLDDIKILIQIVLNGCFFDETSFKSLREDFLYDRDNLLKYNTLISNFKDSYLIKTANESKNNLPQKIKDNNDRGDDNSVKFVNNLASSYFIDFLKLEIDLDFENMIPKKQPGSDQDNNNWKLEDLKYSEIDKYIFTSVNKENEQKNPEYELNVRKTENYIVRTPGLNFHIALKFKNDSTTTSSNLKRSVSNNEPFELSYTDFLSEVEGVSVDQYSYIYEEEDGIHFERLYKFIEEVSLLHKDLKESQTEEFEEEKEDLIKK